MRIVPFTCGWLAAPMGLFVEGEHGRRRVPVPAFLTNAFLLMLCMQDDDAAAATDRLLRPAFGMYRLEWTVDRSVQFNLPHGDWIRLLRGAGFDVEELRELRPPAGASSTYSFVTLDWARQWPSEEVWKARKR